ncbi:MAG: hypothetical protein V1689_08925 [Pseudomonadota bacterium]
MPWLLKVKDQPNNQRHLLRRLRPLMVTVAMDEREIEQGYAGQIISLSGAQR